MSKARAWRLFSIALTACLFATTGVVADAPALSLDQLAHMSGPELEQLYRDAAAGVIPQGYTEGKAIYSPCSPFADLHSHITGALGTARSSTMRIAHS